MILSSEYLTDWIADRRELLIAAWTPEIATMLDWDTLFAEVMAGELHDGMVSTFLKNGTELDFINLVRRSGTGLDAKTERAVAERFFSVTLKLARAASRHIRYTKGVAALPYLRTSGAGDSCTNPGHLALQGIILPHDHPFWMKWHPPLEMECRCGTIQMTRGQLARSATSITSEDDLAEREAHLSAAWPPAFEPLLDFRRRLLK